MALIYIVEDDQNIQEIEMFALKNAGYEVEGFSTGADFWKKVEKKKPDLVLLDIMLPDTDGLEVIRKLRNKKSGEDLPVIMVTARTSEVDKVKGLDM